MKTVVLFAGGIIAAAMLVVVYAIINIALDCWRGDQEHDL